MRKSTMFILTVVLILLNTFAYSALATNLSITGEAVMRAISDIRVTNIAFDSAENDATLYYESKYTKDTITNGFILPNANSSISYNVTIKNNGTIDQAIYDLQTVSSSNNDMIILIDNKPINEALPMIVPFGTSKTIKITYKTNSPGSSVINIINKFIFKEVYYVEYNTKGGSSVETQIKYKDVDLTLEGKPTKNKYVFTGWTDEQNGQAVKYNEGSTYTLNENKTLYAIWRTGEATFIDGPTFNLKVKRLTGAEIPDGDAGLSMNVNTITSIVRANSLPQGFTPTEANIVSTQNSDFPIYAWFDNGTIYYYTIVDNPYMNAFATNMFRGLSGATSIDINTINTSRTEYMHAMFMNCKALTSIDLSNFDTSSVGLYAPGSAMTYLFNGCSSLTSLNLSTFNTSRITSMYYMFGGCSNLQSITFGNNFDTSNVTSMEYMFANCGKLTSLDISNFNTSKVTSMGGMFEGCSSLTSLDLSNFNTSNVLSMWYMFSRCGSLTNLNISNFNAHNVTSMSYMFNSCSSLTTLDISMLDMSSVTSVTNMLNAMTSLQQLKTPKVYPSNLSITLPNTFYDLSNNSYTTLQTGNPTQTWIKLPYTVKYNSNNGTGTMVDQKIGVDATTTLTTNAFTREGYTFAGWNTKADGTGTAYLNNASVTNLKTYNEEITLYAQWIGNTYTIVYNGNGNTGGSTSSSIHTFGESKSLTQNGFTKEGYDFTGWSTSSSDTNIINDDNEYSYDNTNGAQYYDLLRYNAKPPFAAGEVYQLDVDVKGNGLINYFYGTSGSANYLQVSNWINSKGITGTNTDGCNTIDDSNNYYHYSVRFTLSNIGDGNLYKTILFRIKAGKKASIKNIRFYKVSSSSTAYTDEQSVKNLSSTNNSIVNLYALWEKKEATFDTGANFNKKIKQLANPTETVSDHSFNDTNITSIQRANSLPSSWIVNDVVTPPSTNNIVSTNDSKYPIYAWYDNGTIYFYTEALNPYMNSNGSSMFRSLQNVVSIDLTTIDTSKTTSMVYLFYADRNLVNIDLSNFDTSNVVNFDGMFHTCTKLENINLSNFNTSNSISMSSMFAYNQKITSLDLSSFDMTSISNVNYLLTGMTSLKEFKTPNIYPSGVTIDLPKLMIDSSGNEYTTLDSNSPTSTWLYTPSTLDTGSNVNKKIKQLANSSEDVTNYTYSDTNVTSIRRYTNTPNQSILDDAEIISTSESKYPIYAWYDNGTIYYYSKSLYLYLSSTTEAMFYNFKSLESIDLSSINTAKTTNMRDMFNNCISLKEIDLSDFNTISVNNMWGMFVNCRSLKKIKFGNYFNTSNVIYMYAIFGNCTSIENLDLSTFDMSSVTNATNMLNGMTSLQQLKTPNTIPSGVTIDLPKLMIDSSGNEYTQLTSTTPTNTWLYTPATFIDGISFNETIKQLAGTTNAKYTDDDTNITSVQRYTNTPSSSTLENAEIVSTDDSYKKIYAWYSNGIIYYYSEADNVYLNTTANYMFARLTNATTIDLSTIKTSKTTSMNALFFNCRKLTSIDLSHFDTRNVENMYAMFQSCVKLTSIDLSSFNTPNLTNTQAMFAFDPELENIIFGNNFDTSNVTTMGSMFYTCSSITSLDISKLNMSSVTVTTSMLSSMTSLKEFKTPNTYPSDTSVTIALPTTLYDASGNSYSTLTSTSPTSTWLSPQYTITYDLDGGTVSTPNPTSYTKGSSSITLNNPTKAGYRFVGWSGGKNLLKFPVTFASNIDTNSVTLDEMIFIKAGTYTLDYSVENASSWRTIIVMKNANGENLTELSYTPFNGAYYHTNYNSWLGGANTTNTKDLITIAEDCYIRVYVGVGDTSSSTTITNSQLEAGSTSTSYEPYINEQTTVTIPSGSTGNRTYKAIWEEETTQNNLNQVQSINRLNKNKIIEDKNELDLNKKDEETNSEEELSNNDLQASVNNILNKPNNIIKLAITSVITLLIPAIMKFH